MIGFLGAGVMGEALLAGLISAGTAPSDIVVTDKRASRCVELTEAYGVRTGTVAEVAAADVVMVVVKPQDIGGVLDEVAEHVRSSAVVVSVCAGITLAFIESRLPDGTAVVRVMPNTPALVSAGMSALSPGRDADEAQTQQAKAILESVGSAIVVPEKYLDAVTAVSGSGPAYVFYLVESMVDAGVQLGLPRDIATQLAVETAFGSAKLLRDTRQHPTLAREQVTSPGGTTAAAVRRLDDHGVKAAVAAAAEAAARRSRELAAES